jgi:hypothetical protein
MLSHIGSRKNALWSFTNSDVKIGRGNEGERTGGVSCIR